MTSEGGGIARLGALLGALEPQGASAGPREVAELLWLAANLPAGAVVRTAPASGNAAGSETKPSSPGHEVSADDASEAAVGDGEAEQGGRLYLPDADTPGEERASLHRASPVRVAGAPVLPRRRALARSLRPLKRKVPSTTRLVLDEDATADRIADEARWMPVLVPAQDRWLDLALIIDVYGDGAALWKPLGRELLSVLQELGAFRDIRTYWLRRRADGTPGLATSPRQPPRSPATASDPTGRTVTLVLTDGVDSGWGTEALRGALRQWARSGPTAVLQTLPEHLWGQTALAPEPGHFRSTETTGSHARLHFTTYTLGSRAPEPGEIPVPVLSIRPEWLAPWAQAVAGIGEFDGAAVRLHLPMDERAAGDVRVPPPAGRTISFEEFLAQAQPGVFRLAAYLSAAPLNLAVMRLVQSAMLPDSPPSDLAEIVFSGLLRRLPGSNTDGDALQQAYEFAPGVRERLLSTLRRDEADQVIASVSAYVERYAPAGTARFTAAVTDSSGSLLLPAGARHWADVQNLVRRRQRRRASTPAEGAPASATPARSVQEPAPAPHRTAVAVATQPEPFRVRARDLPIPPPDVPARRSRSRFLITIGVSRFQDDHLPPLLGVAEDIARARAGFEALGYTTALTVLADNPTASTVLRSIETWARRMNVRTADTVVVYFAGRAAAHGGQATLLTHDSKASADPGRVRGLTVPQLHRAFSGGPGGLMLILDTCFPTVSDLVLDPQGPPLWLLSCNQVMESRNGSDFNRALTSELSKLRHGSPAPMDLAELVSRVTARMLKDREDSPPDSRSLVSLSPVDPSNFSRFFASTGSPGSTSRTQQADIPLRFEQTRNLQAIADWLESYSDDHRPRIVSGGPGSGKTTLLLYLERRMKQHSSQPAGGLEPGPRRNVRPVLLSAVPNTAAGLWRDIAEQLALPGRSREECVSRLATFPGTLAVLLDRLHEASPRLRQSIVEDVIRPLQTLPAVRLVITEDSEQPVPELGTDVEILRLGAGPHRFNALEGLARSYQDSGVLDRAVALYKEILGDYAKTLGNDHPEIVATQTNLANTYYLMGNLDEAIALHRQIVDNHTDRLGPDHPTTVFARNHLAAMYQQAGRSQEGLAPLQASAPPDRSEGLDDPSVLDQLLALPRAHLVVDGYNVTKTGYPDMPLEKQRLRLLSQLSELAAQTGAEVTSVFDGSEVSAPVLLVPPRGVRVLFSKPGVTADELIHQLVSAEPASRPVIVASTDRALADKAKTAGARPVSSVVLLKRFSQGLRGQSERDMRSAQPGRTEVVSKLEHAAIEDSAQRALSEDDPSVLNQLLALPHAHLVVDGYSLTKAGHSRLSLAKRRPRLLDHLSELASQTGAEVTCVFDGREVSDPVPLVPPRGVRVLFSKPDAAAGELIRQLVSAEPAGRPVIVASSDRDVAYSAISAGARPVASTVLLQLLSPDQPGQYKHDGQQKLAGQPQDAVPVGTAANRNIAPPARVPGVAEEGQEAVRELLARSPAPGLFVRFLEETTSWDNVVVHGIKHKNAQPGAPLDYSRYLRLRRQGSQFGGFAYVYAESSVINLRLNYTKQQLEELGATTARTLDTGHREYRVSVDLTGKQSLDDALRLAWLAYDAT